MRIGVGDQTPAGLNGLDPEVEYSEKLRLDSSMVDHGPCRAFSLGPNREKPDPGQRRGFWHALAKPLPSQAGL